MIDDIIPKLRDNKPLSQDEKKDILEFLRGYRQLSEAIGELESSPEDKTFRAVNKVVGVWQFLESLAKSNSKS